MPDWLRPALLHTGKALEQLTVSSKHSIDEASREDSINRLPVENKFSLRLKYLMIQPYLRRLTYTVERFSPGRWRGTGRILNKQTGENNRHDRLDTFSLHLGQ